MGCGASRTTVVESHTTLVPAVFGEGDEAALGKGCAENRPSVVTDKLAGFVGVASGDGSGERTGTSGTTSSSASSAGIATRRRGQREHEEQTNDSAGQRPGSSNLNRQWRASRDCNLLSACRPCEPVAPQHIWEFFACQMGEDAAVVSPAARAPMLWHRDTQTQQLTHTGNDVIAGACPKQHASAGRCGPNESFPRCLALRLGCGTSSLVQIAISDIEASSTADTRLAVILELLTQPAVHRCGSQGGTRITEKSHLLSHSGKFHTLPTASRESSPGGPAPQILNSPCGKGEDGASFHVREQSHRLVTPGLGDVYG